MAQVRHIGEEVLEDVRRQPQVFRFYLNLFAQPQLDPIVRKYIQRLIDEQARQFNVQTQMFTKLGAANPRQRSLYFSSTLQQIVLIFSTDAENFPLDDVKAEAIAEFEKNLAAGMILAIAKTDILHRTYLTRKDNGQNKYLQKLN